MSGGFALVQILRQWRAGGGDGPERGVDVTRTHVECWEVSTPEESTSRYCSHDAFMAGEMQSLIAAAVGEEVLDEI